MRPVKSVKRRVTTDASGLGRPHSLAARLRTILIMGLRQSIVVALRAVSACGITPAEWAAAQTRRLPKPIWAINPYVRARRLGLFWELDLRDNVQRTLYFTGWYERRYLTLLRQQVRRGDVYIDVGAHIGIHAQVIARDLLTLEGRVVAFEPSPDTAARLRRTSAVNGLTNLQVVNVALGAKRGEMELRSDPSRFEAADMAVLSFYGPGPSIGLTDVISLDEWVKDTDLSAIDFVKVDVEGAEQAVLQGMQDSIRTFRPRLIGIEIRDYLLLQAGTSEAQLRSFLKDLGYGPVDTGDLEGNYMFAAVDTSAQK